MTGCSSLPAIHFKQSSPMLHESVPTENAEIPPMAPQLVIEGRLPTITSGPTTGGFVDPGQPVPGPAPAATPTAV